VQDFVPGAYMAFENDHELVPYYKKFFYQRGAYSGHCSATSQLKAL
jgi:hypothetical protein